MITSQQFSSQSTEWRIYPNRSRGWTLDMISIIVLILIISQSYGQRPSCPGKQDDFFCDNLSDQKPEYYLGKDPFNSAP